MYKRLLCALTAFALLFSTAPLAASAQADSGQIVITVNDGANKAPISLARVLLDGPVMTSEYSGANGAVKFTDVPDGIYRARVFKGGYQGATSEQFEVSNGRVVTVAVVLAKVEQLTEIGSITVKSSATVTTSSIAENSAQRKLSSTLTDALNKISGVSVSTSADSDQTTTVSLQGQDASQTALTLDGIPLNAPGMAGNLGSIGGDLFRGASVSFGPQNGGMAGGVNFRTLEPTLSWQGTASLSAGSYGRYNWSFGETGSLGKKLGIAVQHTARTTPSLANGMRFLDASGLNYEHDAQNSNTGDLLKLRYRLGNAQTLSATYLASNNSNDVICLQVTGALPCGYGPNNQNQSHFDMMSLSDSALVGSTAVQASLFQNSVRFNRDLLNRYLNGIPDPTGSLTDTTTRGFSVSALLPAKERHTISISASSMTSSSETTPLIASARPFANGSQTTSYSSVSVNDAIQSSTKLKLNERIGLTHATNSPAALLAGVSAIWNPTTADTYTASYTLGGSGAHAGPLQNLSDPHSLRFDCNGNVAYGSAPGDLPSANSSTDARIGLTHKFAAGIVNASLYRQVQNGMVLNTQVNGSVLGGFPAGYFAAVQAQYDSPGGCNAGAGAPFGAQNVYFSVPVGGVKRVYQGAQVAANFTFGNLNVQPYYDITVAQAVSSDPRINNPYSIITSGGQLPNQPLHKAGLTLDYKAPRSAIEELVSAQYVGSNNGQNLPAYTVVDAGLNAHFARGDLTFAANNIFNTYGGIFATNVGAVPYTTQSGTFVPTIARPNSPREFSVTWTVPIGASAKNAPAINLASAVGGDGEGARGGQGGRRGFQLVPLPATPPADPLAMNSSNAACTADAQKSAAPVFAALKSYVASIEAAKAANGGAYPATMPAGPALPGTSITYHKTVTSYALSLELQRVSAQSNAGVAAFPACVALHLAQPEDVQSRGLYAPAQNTPFMRPALQFMPSVGFYIPRQQPQAGQQSFRLYKLPTTPPANAFAVKPSDVCKGEVQTAATNLLGELQAYFTSGKPLRTWKVTPHTSTAGTWYELSNDDVTTIPALLNCGRVAAATTDEVKATGFDGVRPPGLNYSPKLGIYLVRGNGQGGPGGQNGAPGTRPNGPPNGAPPPPGGEMIMHGGPGGPP